MQNYLFYLCTISSGIKSGLSYFDYCISCWTCQDIKHNAGTKLLGYTNVSEFLVLHNKFRRENITLFKYVIHPFVGSDLIPLKPTEDFNGNRQRQKNAEVFLLLKIFQLWYLSHFRGKYDLNAQMQSTDFLVINMTLFQIQLEILRSICRNTAVAVKFVSAQKWPHLSSTTRKDKATRFLVLTAHFLPVDHYPQKPSQGITSDTFLRSDGICSSATSGLIYIACLLDFKAWSLQSTWLHAAFGPYLVPDATNHRFGPQNS